MKIKNTLVNEISKEEKLDPRVVRLIADYPIKFARDRISDPEDMRPTRIRYFAVLTPKSGYEKQYKGREN